MVQKIGRFFTFLFVGFLPWSVVISVFGTERLDFGLVRFSKEIFLVVLVCTFLYDFIKNKKRVIFDSIDLFIGLYVVSLLLVSLFTGTPVRWIMYGLRYDTEFLIVFVLMRQAIRFWGIHFQDIAKVFIISGGLMLCASLLIRYIFGETLLMIFGFSGRVSVWDGSWPPPIYHGIPGASVVRFQGMLEGPNQMAFFLLTYIGTYISVYFRFKKYRFINTLIVLLLIFLLTQTYSRSGLLGLVLWASYLGCDFLLKKIRTFHAQPRKKIAWKKITITGLCFFMWGLLIFFQFAPKFTEIMARKWSTSAHFERMYIGYLRFLEQPLWHGLAQAGPASRSIAEVSQVPMPIESLNPEMRHLSGVFLAQNPDFVFSTEHYYIPESWYIQQLVEGGAIVFVFFVGIFVSLILACKKYPVMIAVLLGVFVMNAFLHAFESTHTSLNLFIILASLLKKV